LIVDQLRPGLLHLAAAVMQSILLLASASEGQNKQAVAGVEPGMSSTDRNTLHQLNIIAKELLVLQGRWDSVYSGVHSTTPCPDAVLSQLASGVSC